MQDRVLRQTIYRLAQGFSIEVNVDECRQIHSLRAALPVDTRVYLPSLHSEDANQHLRCLQRIAAEHLQPVPHIVARRIFDAHDLERKLIQLHSVQVEDVLIVAGDDVKPAGAFADSLQLLRTDLFEQHAIKRVGFAVHPQGLAHASQDVLDACLREKLSDATRRGIHAYLVTQLFFDTQAIINWLVQQRAQGINCEIRLSIHGVVISRRLYDFAHRLEIPGTKLLQEALTDDQHIIGPQRLLVELGKAIANQSQLAPVGLHFCSLGGFPATARLSSALAAGKFAISSETNQQKSLKLI